MGSRTGIVAERVKEDVIETLPQASQKNLLFYQYMENKNGGSEIVSLLTIAQATTAIWLSRKKEIIAGDVLDRRLGVTSREGLDSYLLQNVV